MNTIRQLFFNKLTTLRTRLCCSSGVDFNKCSASVFGFVAQNIKELCPCRIIDIFIKGPEIIFNHIFRLKFFNKDVAVIINYFTRKFMLKIFALISDLLMQFRNGFSCSLAFLYRMLPLKIDKFVLALFKIFGVVDNLAIRHNGKRFYTYINANFLGRSGKDVLRNGIARKRSVEAAILPFNCNSFDFAF